MSSATLAERSGKIASSRCSHDEDLRHVKQARRTPRSPRLYDRINYNGRRIGCPRHYKADVEIPQGGAEGMIVTQGGPFGGYGFYLLKGKRVFLNNFFDVQRTRWEAPDALSPGKHTLEFDFKYDDLGFGTLAFNNVSGIGRGGTGVLKVDGREVARQTMERTIPLVMQWDENFDIGADTGTPADDQDYQVPFKFTGTLDKQTLTIDRPKLSPADIERLKEATRNNRAAE